MYQCLHTVVTMIQYAIFVQRNAKKEKDYIALKIKIFFKVTMCKNIFIFYIDLLEKKKKNIYEK